MRLLKIATAYPAYLVRFYSKHPALRDKTYAQQKAAFDYDGFGWPGWTKALQPLGYEVVELLSNAGPLQKAWADEQGIKYRKKYWFNEIVEAQVIQEKPDVLFIADYNVFTFEWVKELREKCPSIRLVLGWCGAPFFDPSIFKGYDLTLSCIPELVDKFHQLGFKSEHIHHGFDPLVLERINNDTEPDIDCSFIGQLVRNSQFHLERDHILEQLVSQIDIRIFSPSADMGLGENFKSQIKLGAYYLLSLFKSIGIQENMLRNIPLLRKAADWRTPPVSPVNPKLKTHLNSAVFGLEMFQTLRNSKLTLNSHIDVSPRSASNVRLFEATGVGTCLITDWKENISELFEPDKEVVTYKSPAECVEKAKWLLQNHAQRKAIAKAGQSRTLRDHTFARRAERLDEIIKRMV